MKKIAMMAALFAAACSGGKVSGPNDAASPSDGLPKEASSAAPAGEYRLDKAHASLVFSVDHVTYSKYTANFDAFDAVLQFDPIDPEAMSVATTIDVRSLDLPSPPAGFLDTLFSEDWFAAEANPTITFQSTKVTQTSANTARIDGDLAFRGVTAPVSFDATYNGGYAGFPPYDPNARIGFSATGALKRSDFGFIAGLPTEEFPVGVGDLVSFRVEAEFTGPPTP